MTPLEFHSKLINIQDSLMRFAQSLTHNKEDAEDLVQETCLKALKHKDQFICNSSLKAWAFTILKNTFINNYRSSRRKITHANHPIEHYQDYALSTSHGDNPQSIFISNELEQTIEKLDERHKRPFKLHFTGYKYKEIAERLNLNIGTVKSRIFLSRKKLIEKLKDYN